MKLINGFVNAGRGLAIALREEMNLRIHLIAVVVVTAAGFYLGIERWEWCALILTFGLVIALELVNTAIENLTDLVSPERNPMPGRIKDISASAVLVAAIVAVLVAVVIFSRYY